MQERQLADCWNSCLQHASSVNLPCALLRTLAHVCNWLRRLHATLPAQSGTYVAAVSLAN